MDRDRTLRDLDQPIQPEGAVVLASGGAPGDVAPAPWLEVIAEVRTRYLGPERRAGSSAYSHPRTRVRPVRSRHWQHWPDQSGELTDPELLADLVTQHATHGREVPA